MDENDTFSSPNVNLQLTDTTHKKLLIALLYNETYTTNIQKYIFRRKIHKNTLIDGAKCKVKNENAMVYVGNNVYFYLAPPLHINKIYCQNALLLNRAQIFNVIDSFVLAARLGDAQQLMDYAIFDSAL